MTIELLSFLDPSRSIVGADCRQRRCFFALLCACGVAVLLEVQHVLTSAERKNSPAPNSFSFSCPATARNTEYPAVQKETTPDSNAFLTNVTPEQSKSSDFYTSSKVTLLGEAGISRVDHLYYCKDRNFLIADDEATRKELEVLAPRLFHSYESRHSLNVGTMDDMLEYCGLATQKSFPKVQLNGNTLYMTEGPHDFMDHYFHFLELFLGAYTGYRALSSTHGPITHSFFPLYHFNIWAGKPPNHANKRILHYAAPNGTVWDVDYVNYVQTKCVDLPDTVSVLYEIETAFWADRGACHTLKEANKFNKMLAGHLFALPNATHHLSEAMHYATRVNVDVSYQASLPRVAEKLTVEHSWTGVTNVAQPNPNVPLGKAIDPRAIRLGYANRIHNGRRLVDASRELLLEKLRAVRQPPPYQEKPLFDIVDYDLGSLSWEDQVGAMSHVDLLLGVHGNALSNALWLPPGAMVVEIFPPKAQVFDYQFMALIRGVTYLGATANDPRMFVRPFSVDGHAEGSLREAPFLLPPKEQDSISLINPKRITLDPVWIDVLVHEIQCAWFDAENFRNRG